MSDHASAGQVSASAARIYDAFFVPALFGQWAETLCDAAAIAPGARVLDVACGTGATTRAAKARAGPGGSVIGLDRNADMLAVARSHASEIRWVEGRAEELPFADHSFDAVLCQFGLMFFDDRPAALSEMRRVVRPVGRIALSVWDDVRNSPGYARMIALIDRRLGAEPADALRAPFVLGTVSDLQDVARAGGLYGAQIRTCPGTARFASIEEWVRIDVRGWTLSDMIDDDQFDELLTAAKREFGDLVSPAGTLAFPAPAHVVTWSPQ